jgi:chemotaxis protein CheC
MVNQDNFDQKLFELLQTIAEEGIHNAARGFSSLLGHKIEVSQPVVHLVPILDIPKIVGGLESEAIGIYLRVEGDIAGQIMLIIPYQKALELVDLLMDLPSGTTTYLGSLERSALGEVGNLTGSFFLNSVAKLTGISVRPTPPAVLVDMVGAILDIIIATTGGVTEHVILLRADFVDGGRRVDADFWVIPDAATIQVLRAGNA